MTEETHNQIEELQKLHSKQKLYLIPKNPKDNQVQANIGMIPLSLDEIAEFEGAMKLPEDQMREKVFESLAKSMSTDLPNVKKFSVEHMNDLMDAFHDCNNIDKEQQEKGKTTVTKFLENKEKLITAEKKADEELQESQKAAEVPETQA